VPLLRIVACAKIHIPLCEEDTHSLQGQGYDMAKVNDKCEDNGSVVTCKFEAEAVTATSIFEYNDPHLRVITTIKAGEESVAVQAKYHSSYKAKIFYVAAKSECKIVHSNANIKAIHFWNF
jgi:hypothetical protein